MTTWRPSRPRDLVDSRADPRPVGESLDRLAARLGAPGAAAVSTVFSHWPDVVGPAVSAHTRPLSLRDGVLVVAVDDPGWATQLRYLGADVIRRLKELVGEAGIDRLEVRVRPR